MLLSPDSDSEEKPAPETWNSVLFQLVRCEYIIIFNYCLIYKGFIPDGSSEDNSVLNYVLYNLIDWLKSEHFYKMTFWLCFYVAT